MNKYLIFAAIVVVSVFADLATKRIAEQNLASATRRWEHPIERVVEADGETTLAQWIDAEFGAGTAAADPPRVHGVYRIGEDGSQVGPLDASYPLSDGDRLSVRHREVQIVPGFWNHVYVQNFGAAWGFLAEGNERFVRPFFLVVSVIAVFIVLGIFRNVRPDQKVLMVALSLIVGGAIGNFIDRARYGYVVDFIDWYVTIGGRERHWPTFNVADVWITIGVALMILEMGVSGPPDKRAAGKAPAGGDTDESEAA